MDALAIIPLVLGLIFVVCGNPKWGRKFGRPAVVPLSWMSRLLWALFISTFIAGGLAKSLHYDTRKLFHVAGPVLLIIFVLMILSGVRDRKRFKDTHGPDA
jgi:hypothetical protein